MRKVKLFYIYVGESYMQRSHYRESFALSLLMSLAIANTRLQKRTNCRILGMCGLSSRSCGP